MIIINADDFGLSSKVNEAIIRSFENGSISSTTLMANMPGFEDAIELAHQKKIVNNIGLHLNLTAGEPLTDKMKKTKIFCKDGVFHFKRFTHYYFNENEREAIRLEVQAQIDKCRIAGIKLSHSDSHHHVHNELALFSIIKNVLDENKIKKIRKSSIGNSNNPVKKIYGVTFNNFIYMNGFTTTKKLYCLGEYVHLKNSIPSNVTEVIVHPVYNDKKEVVDSKTKIRLDETFHYKFNIKLNNYNSLN